MRAFKAAIVNVGKANDNRWLLVLHEHSQQL